MGSHRVIVRKTLYGPCMGMIVVTSTRSRDNGEARYFVILSVSHVPSKRADVKRHQRGCDVSRKNWDVTRFRGARATRNHVCSCSPWGWWKNMILRALGAAGYYYEQVKKGGLKRKEGFYLVDLNMVTSLRYNCGKMFDWVSQSRAI